MKRWQNTFIAFLDLLKVKYTKNFTNQYFNEHPHKYNLFGLSKMLSEYSVENTVIRTINKEKSLIEFETPFIAHFRGDFAIVQKIENEVSFLWKGNNHVLPFSSFIKSWTGIVLLAKSSEKSIEPNYEKHKAIERQNFIKKVLLFSACSLIIFLSFLSDFFYIDIGGVMLLLINLAGIFICWLLLLKQMHIKNQYADKICSLFTQSNCNNVLEGSRAIYLWASISWSEIGLGYFCTNIFILIFFPALITYVALINIIALPYTFWSIWYQHSKAKQWCILCLIVQALLWIILIINCLWNYIRMPIIDFSELVNMVMLGSCYFVSILSINVLIPKLNIDNSILTLQQSINSIKADESIFEMLLKRQPYYEINDNDSVIRFGNPNSSLRLTIVSNPYCPPCSIMHKRIEQLLEKVNNNIHVQYILSSYNESLNSTNKQLIAACLVGNNDSAKQILSDWFEKGKELRDIFFNSLSIDMENPEIEIEFQKHESWRKKNQIWTIPTVLVNGYQLPNNYQIEDLQYFIDLDISFN